MTETAGRSRTHEALGNFLQALDALRPAERLAAPVEIGRFSTGLEERIFHGTAPEPELLEQLRARIVRALESGSPVISLSTMEWQDTPWLLFAPGTGQPLIAAMPFRRGLLQAAYRGPRVTYAIRLIDAYLRHFDPRHAEEFSFLGATILELLSVTRGGSTAAAVWWQRHHELSLFEAGAAPSRLANRLLIRGADDLLPGLEEAGLAGSLAGGGLSQAALLKYAENPPGDAASTRAIITRWRELCAPCSGDGDALLVQALLQPWLRREPSLAWREWFLAWLPELVRQPGGIDVVLAAMEPEARARLGGWLEAGAPGSPAQQASIPAEVPNAFHGVADFYDLLEQHAEESGDNERLEAWREQRRFWEEYAQSGFILETRLALGADLISHFGRKSLRGRLKYRFARLNGFGGAHSVMLLRFQRLVVLVNSHHVRCRLWRLKAPHAPDLQADVFHRAELLRRPPTDMHVVPGDRHTGVPCPAADSAAWQRLIRDFIREHSGESLPSTPLASSAPPLTD